MSTEHSTSKNERLLPIAIDEIAAQEPDATWAIYPKSPTSYDDGFRTITYAQIANGINGAAWWIKKSLGLSNKFDTIAYLGPNDARYPIFVLASIKTGYQILLPSQLNKTAAQVSLFEKLDCKALITATPDSAATTSITESYDVKILAPPSLDELLDGKHDSFVYEKSWEDGQFDPFVVLHTSGSTGLPKPIIVPHAFAAAFANMTQLEPPSGYVNQTRYLHGKTIFSTLPFFHAVGVYFGIISTVFNRTTLVFPLSGRPPTGSAVAEACKQLKIDAAFIPPPVLEDIGKSKSLLDEVVANLKTIVFTGGDLPKEIGDRVAPRIHTFAIYGTSEMGHGPQIQAKDSDWKDWKYFQWNEDAVGLEWRKFDNSLYELCLRKDDRVKANQTGFTIFRDDDEMRTKDLFAQHPEKPGLWTYVERADNIIVFLNGEKLNPTGVEGRITSHADVKSALLIGNQQYHAALLLEMADQESDKDHQKIIEELWPTIQRANEDAPEYARVSKSHIIFTDPDKPMVRTPKGTLIRAKTLEAYAAEIKRLYSAPHKLSRLQSVTSGGEPNLELLEDPDELQSYLSDRICRVMSWDEVEFEDDFIAAGMESVKALQLQRHLRNLTDVNLGTIYQNPSVKQLAQAMLNNRGARRDSHAGIESTIESILEDTESGLDALRRTLSKQGGGIDEANDAKVVLLTGSSGNVGRYVLHSLVQDSQISHIYCLNRSADADRHTISNVDNKVTFLTGSVDREEFGLETEAFSDLGHHVTHIIHNAWTVDFNLALHSFTGQISGIVNLVNFTAAAQHQPALTFLSSISAVQNYTSGKVPEEILTDPGLPGQTGYGQSKWIAENLMDRAAKKLGIDARVLRLGQVAGPAHLQGTWNKREWLPSMVISSITFGKIPETLPMFVHKSGEKEVDWIPIDDLAQIISELALKAKQESSPSGAYVCNLSNTRSCSWSSLIPAVVEAIGPVTQKGNTKAPLQIVPYDDWFERLKEVTKVMDEGDVTRISNSIPAVKLFDFFQSVEAGSKVPRLGTENAERDSEEMRHLQAITPEAMQRWTETWVQRRPGTMQVRGASEIKSSHPKLARRILYM